jgi:hypothetical protein
LLIIGVTLKQGNTEAMRALYGIRTIFTKLAARIVPTQYASRVSCCDGEQNDQRGLLTASNDIAKDLQIDRDGDNRPRPPAGYYSAVWPP